MIPGILAEMRAALIANLEKLVGTPRDGALLRYSLGSEYLKAGARERGIEHLREALMPLGRASRDHCRDDRLQDRRIALA